MGVPKDITGRKCGLLTAIRDTGKRTSRGGHIWICQCECGNFVELRAGDIHPRARRSCGCIKKYRIPKGRKIDPALAYVMHEEQNMTYAEIGRHFGAHATTVCRAINSQIEKLYNASNQTQSGDITSSLNRDDSQQVGAGTDSPTMG